MKLILSSLCSLLAPFLAVSPAMAQDVPPLINYQGKLTDTAGQPLPSGRGVFGPGSTNDFNAPDLRGRFLRGLDGGAGNDPDRAGRFAGPAGGNSGDSVGSLQSDAFASHRHEMSGLNNADRSGVANVGGVGAGSAPSGFFVAAAGGSETRPKNACVQYIIKW
jgi:hypothetical protein